MSREVQALTLSQVAERLNITYATVYAMVHDGRLRSFRLGNGSHARFRVTEEDLTAFVMRDMAQP